jgi:O-antigen/teichoic acid export membrane protein
MKTSLPSGFAHLVRILVGGTVSAHAIFAAFLVVVTRLYTPTDFSLLAVFASMVSTLASVACLRFDVAIPIPKDDVDGANILGLALLCTLGASVLIFIASMTALALTSVHQTGLGTSLWLLPLAVMLAGSFSALQFWFVRKQRFATLARTRVAQTCVGSGAQTGLGAAHVAPLGLLLGPVLNSGAGCVGLISRILREDKDPLRNISWRRMCALFATYERFPKYSTLEALSNQGSHHLPIVMIGTVTTAPEAGFLLLAMYALQIPMSLIGNAVSHVYLSVAPEEFRRGHLRELTSSIFGSLVKTGVGPFVFASIVAPSAFTQVFGEDWRRAGLLVSWLMPCYVMEFLAVPIAVALHVTNQQKVAFILQLLGLVLRVSLVCCAAMFAVELISEAYAVSGFVFYAIYLGVVLRTADVRAADVIQQVRGGLFFIVAWSLAGYALVISFLAVQSLLRPS